MQMTPQPIDGATQLVGLIGWPVAHSRSPAMHNAAFAALGLNGRYVPLPAPPGRVGDAVRGLLALGFRGANVTAPHKESVLAHVDALSPAAQMIGAVNTLVIDHSGVSRNGMPARVTGHNTDVPGFLAALEDAHVDPAGKRAVLVGAGGAARAVVAALLMAEAEMVTVLNRTPERADRLVADLREHSHRTQLRAAPLTCEALVEAARAGDLLINATTIGMTPHDEASIWPEDAPLPSPLVVADLVYAPRQTRLLHQARAASAQAIGGLGMLVHQGALAFDLWTDHRYDLAEITAPMFHALDATP